MKKTFGVLFLLFLSWPAYGDRKIHFSYIGSHCNTTANYLQGQLTFFNPGTAAITVTVNTTLSYNTGTFPGCGVAKVDGVSSSFSVPAGGSNLSVTQNTALACGCHSVFRFYGTITVTGNSGYLIANGNILTSTSNNYDATKQEYMNLPVAVNGGKPF